MFSSTRLLVYVLAATTASSAVRTLVKPGVDVPTIENTLKLEGTDTDVATIVQIAEVIDQKGGANDAVPPGLPPVDTIVTAIDGTLTQAGESYQSNFTAQALRSARSSTSTILEKAKRSIKDYRVVFNGTGVSTASRDGSIQGTAYLTYTLVDNSTYNVVDCLDFCSRVNGCVFANLYYEFNNPGLDAGFSNLKCAVYADVHSAKEKTNTGGQQQYPAPGGLTFVQHSSGYAASSLEDPATPEGYELTFGPLGGANNSPGYMGFAFLDRYDVKACTDLCNSRGADHRGGGCQYVNIWRAVVNGNPTTYSCSFYYVPSDASTAHNTGQGDLKVTFSRGYRRKTLVLDGGFENFLCANGEEICWVEKTKTWIGTSPLGGFWDALIFNYAPYAHSGNSVATLGSGDGSDSLPGTLTPAKALTTVKGKKYSIQFFHASNYNAELNTGAFVDILWNGKVVSTIRPGVSDWTFFQFDVVAKGKDKLAFRGGAYPAYDFIDDVYVFLA